MSTEEEILALVKEESPENPIEYVCSIVRPLAKQQLDSQIRSCKDCPACKFTDIKSTTYGDPQASVLIVNEGIYASQLGESKEVYPLQGAPEMEYLDKIIEAYHINRRQLYWVNAVNCFTCTQVNGKNIERTPNSHEADYCRGYVDYAIEILHPVLIILLGNIPLNLFQRGKSIMQAHGQWIEICGIKAMPVYSPHFLLQMKQDKDKMPELVEEYECDFCEDLRKAFVYVQDNFRGNVLLEHLEA